MRMLRVVREAKEKKLMDLAMDVPIDYNYLREYELGRRNIGEDKLKDIAEYLGSTVEEISKEITRREYNKITPTRKMRNIKNYRIDKGLSIENLSKISGVSYGTIQRFEQGYYINTLLVTKLSKALRVSKVEISKPLETREEFTNSNRVYNTPCLNQVCPLNKDCICHNDVVLEGRAGCASKDKISKPLKTNNNSDRFLMVDRR